MSNEELLKLAETMLARSPETGDSDGLKTAAIMSIAASLLAIARKLQDKS